MSKQKENNSLPPFARSWRQLYWMVVVCLVITVLAMYLFSKYFS